MRMWNIDAGVTPDEARAPSRGMEPDDRRQVEGVHGCRDGSTVPVEVHIRRLNAENEDLFVVISRDVTEQTDRGRELYAQNERLEEFVGVDIWRVTGGFWGRLT
jgi:PAS domain S-box